ncbi:uncharacterized protein C8R40DRAFT_153718 [Lentinula edodes]|uniref:uncharacterized protein n=1 Tax=Lentinula edodes TaxID=5353 RepID=UPI001E8DBB18|nr:uncharacterized protein C8R40DRAFT_153718 [Lentinula edodes]KAH7876184.1 hypothetical protein C8R40DRAFT_153718 [Lentinula edodes]
MCGIWCMVYGMVVVDSGLFFLRLCALCFVYSNFRALLRWALSYSCFGLCALSSFVLLRTPSGVIYAAVQTGRKKGFRENSRESDESDESVAVCSSLVRPVRLW